MRRSHSLPENAKHRRTKGWRRKRAGVAQWAYQLVATVLFEGASQRSRVGMEGSSPDRMSRPGSPSGSPFISERLVGSGACEVCASPSRGRL